MYDSNWDFITKYEFDELSYKDKVLFIKRYLKEEACIWLYWDFKEEKYLDYLQKLWINPYKERINEVVEEVKYKVLSEVMWMVEKINENKFKKLFEIAKELRWDYWYDTSELVTAITIEFIKGNEYVFLTKKTDCWWCTEWVIWGWEWYSSLYIKGIKSKEGETIQEFVRQNKNYENWYFVDKEFKVFKNINRKFLNEIVDLRLQQGDKSIEKIKEDMENYIKSKYKEMIVKKGLYGTYFRVAGMKDKSNEGYGFITEVPNASKKVKNFIGFFMNIKNLKDVKTDLFNSLQKIKENIEKSLEEENSK